MSEARSTSDAGAAGGGIRHPFSGALYEGDGSGNVRVVDGEHWGLFTPRGVWIEGDLRFADPQLCGWVGGPRVKHHRLQIHDD